MQTLNQSLQDEDIGRLRIIAELWGIDLPTGNVRTILPELIEQMLNPELCDEILEALPDQAREIFHSLHQNAGRLPYADLARKYGPIRAVGPGRRDREKIWRNPTSALETLWFRGLLGRAFDHSTLGMQEYAFIPHEFISDSVNINKEIEPYGNKGTIPNRIHKAGLAILDDCTTLLADLRRNPHADPHQILDNKEQLSFLREPRARDFLVGVLIEESVLSESTLMPDPEQTRSLLSQPPIKTLLQINQAWRQSPTWNDLAQISTLEYPQDAWPNTPLSTRNMVLSFLGTIPLQTWWNLAGFIAAVYERSPSFQRPAADFDSWYIRSKSSGEFLRGFEHWHEIEAQLLRYIITGPLFWTGAVLLGYDKDTGLPDRFLLSPLFNALQNPPLQNSIEKNPIKCVLQSQGRILIPIETDPTFRYQIARATSWEAYQDHKYQYRITPEAFNIAQAQGFQVKHMLALLDDADVEVPAGLRKAITRWQARGTEVTVSPTFLLRVKNQETAQLLLNNKRTARFITEQMNDTVLLVLENNLERLRDAALLTGIMISIPVNK